MANKGGMDLTDDRYREFMEKLAHDDDFREELTKRPREVMDEYGVPYDSERIPDPVVLAPKREIQDHLDEHVLHLKERGANQIPHPVFVVPPKHRHP